MPDVPIGPIYAYDTEFLEDGRTIELISIGIVCEDGREYYAVNSDMDHKRIAKDDWLCQNVVPHLPLSGKGYRGVNPYKSDTGRWVWSLDTKSTLVKPKWVIANEVREFLLAVDPPQLWANYAAYDHVVLAQLWGRMISLPKGLPMFTHDLQQLLETMADFEKPEQDGTEHNAIEDARWVMKVLRAAGKVPSA
ncbi:Rnase H [Mycobacterium phage Poenanya]|uniref:DnaQ-like DNA polymerase III subunit n=2 Tax=Cheoctovirus TaxID=1623281 RepID=A0A076YNS3_9CAUD|nr:Rnase H [Mycobacterium phage Inventum]YP_009961369.1 Rnase H [Mycobacterium phage Poenanya]QFP96083.1 DnaQ-like DNA polymerase III subunit [Mycobacterium phage Doomphist]QWY82560.1 DnaQ-like DNA polymerase III subunit [Mycobacterium phage Sassafras]AIK67681.1 DnaQ-like DNA polymerase III subunit [Mycobacterium phage Inventum]QAX92626.1 DnaQ-like DNA polymerase III subunit [Mycobacterium phage Poenanya]